MAIIIETCPKCGHDLMDEVICTYPPIPRKSCPSCGWSWEGEPEQIMRVPFGGNSFNYDNLTLHGNTDYECVNSLATTMTACAESAINTGEIMFEQYHKRLMEYIGMHDELILLGYTTCPKCGATIKNDKCDKCSNYNFEEDGLTD